MQQVKNGDTVRVNYHGKLTDGSTFDSSEGREPLEFAVGAGQVIKGFDDALVGMTVGEKKTVHIPVDQAYGQRTDDMMITHARTEFPADIDPVPGLELHMSDNMGNVFPVVITEVTDTEVVLDANHALAGEDLIFDIELVSIA